jgi:hypothetical protein
MIYDVPRIIFATAALIAIAAYACAEPAPRPKIQVIDADSYVPATLPAGFDAGTGALR